MFSMTNEAKVLVILEALRIFSSSFLGNLIVESNYSNAISWMKSTNNRPWKFSIIFR